MTIAILQIWPQIQEIFPYDNKLQCERMKNWSKCKTEIQVFTKRNTNCNRKKSETEEGRIERVWKRNGLERDWKGIEKGFKECEENRMEFELFPGAPLPLRMMVIIFHYQYCLEILIKILWDLFPGDVLHGGLPGWDHPRCTPRCPRACLWPEGLDRGWRYGHHFTSFVPIWIFPLEVPQIKEKRKHLEINWKCIKQVVGGSFLLLIAILAVLLLLNIVGTF